MSLNKNDTVKDCLFLCAIVVLSFALYIKDLGFYTDVWYLLSNMFFSKNQSLFGVFRAIYIGGIRNRPMQVLELAALYKVFGLQPLGYNIVNGFIFLAGIVLFYLALSELRLARLIALSVPLIYSLLPHYSTLRFWSGASYCVFCMTMYFLSFYAGLRLIRARDTCIWGWGLLSILSMIAGNLAYEIFIPLFMLNPVIIWYYGKKLNTSTSGRQSELRKSIVLLGSYYFLLTGIIAFKALTNVRVDSFSLQPGFFIAIISKALVISYGDYLIGLPLIISQILRDYFNLPALILGVLLGVMIFAYLYKVSQKSKEPLNKTFNWGKSICVGLIIFVLGYALFLIVRTIGITPTGISNRVSVAAAVGIAISLAGVFGGLAIVLSPKKLRKQFFCGFVALFCAITFLINNTIATFWVAASRRQKEILADIRRQFPTLPPGSTLLLDGIRPYIGPGIVFECHWDTGGALKILYRDNTLKGDVVTPRLEIEKDGISTTIYGKFRRHYPYGKKLLLYNFKSKKVYQITNAKKAQDYFQTFNPNYNSDYATGKEGYGVPIFFSFFPFLKKTDQKNWGIDAKHTIYFEIGKKTFKWKLY